VVAAGVEAVEGVMAAIAVDAAAAGDGATATAGIGSAIVALLSRPSRARL